jgi:hypothetical protein
MRSFPSLTPKVLTWAVLFASTACATVVSSGVNQTGPDTYALSVRAGRSQGGLIGAEGLALEEAGDFCKRKSREILVLTSGPTRGAYRATFQCLPAGDPDLRRATSRFQPTAS